MTASTIPTQSVAWEIARKAGLTGLLVLLLGLLTYPGITLDLFWKVVVPLVPAMLFVNPVIWRNLCPLSSLNQGSADGISIERRWFGLLTAVGVLLLFAMVPARHLIFNSNGPVLAATIVAVGALSWITGRFFSSRSGFCNSICPVLSVERLYGGSPLLKVERNRCHTCNACVAGCLDVSARAGAVTALGGQRKPDRWFRSSFGAFAASFPGFVLGYFTVPVDSQDSILGVYGHVLIYALVSYVLFVVVALLSRATPRTMLQACAAAAGGLYFWFAPIGMSDVLHIGAAGMWTLRAASLSLVAFWFYRATARELARS